MITFQGSPLLRDQLHPHEKYDVIIYTRPGGRLNKKDGLTRYDYSHVKDKTS